MSLTEQESKARRNERSAVYREVYKGVGWKGTIVPPPNRVVIPVGVGIDRDFRATLVPRNPGELILGDPVLGRSAAERMTWDANRLDTIRLRDPNGRLRSQDPLDGLIFRKKLVFGESP